MNFLDNTNQKSKQPVAFPTESEQIEETARQEFPIYDPSINQQEDVEKHVTEFQEMDEAERRVIKAGYYRDVLNCSLFGDDEEPEAYEVEEEIRTFARERLRVYLGMSADTKRELKEVQMKLPFSEKQVQVLVGWADSLISKPKLLGAMVSSQRGRPIESRSEPVIAEKPEPARTSVVQQIEQSPRRRGRPPGTGKHQKAAIATDTVGATATCGT
jgi:hypothetical protein